MQRWRTSRSIIQFHQWIWRDQGGKRGRGKEGNGWGKEGGRAGKGADVRMYLFCIFFGVFIDGSEMCSSPLMTWCRELHIAVGCPTKGVPAQSVFFIKKLPLKKKHTIRKNKRFKKRENPNFVNLNLGLKNWFFGGGFAPKKRKTKRSNVVKTHSEQNWGVVVTFLLPKYWFKKHWVQFTLQSTH